MLARVLLRSNVFPAREMPKKTKFYAVAKGRNPGVYEDWNSCSSQVNGYTGNVYASFGSRAEAEEYINNNRGLPSVSSASTGLGRSSRASAPSSSRSGYHGTGYDSVAQYASNDGNYDEYDDSYGSRPPRSSGSSYQAPSVRHYDSYASTPSYGSSYQAAPAAPYYQEPSYTSPLESEDQRFQYTPVYATSSWRSGGLSSDSQAAAPAAREKTPITVYTDGACSGNGQAHSYAGVGVYFGPQDSRNVSRPLEGHKQTNQRAEMEAALDAMLATRDDSEELIVHTDSMYVVNGMNSWMQNWKTQEKWDKLENSDIWRRLKEAREDRAGKTSFVHVRGHSGDPGNEQADRLAVAGAKQRR